MRGSWGETGKKQGRVLGFFRLRQRVKGAILLVRVGSPVLLSPPGPRQLPALAHWTAL